MRDSLPGNIPLFCYKRDGDVALADLDEPDIGRSPTDVGKALYAYLVGWESSMQY